MHHFKSLQAFLCGLLLKKSNSAKNGSSCHDKSVSDFSTETAIIIISCDFKACYIALSYQGVNQYYQLPLHKARSR